MIIERLIKTRRKYYKFVSATHLFLTKKNKILLLRRQNTGYEDGNYSVVAGHIDGGETARKSMIREAKEEAGIKIKINDLKLAHVMHRKGEDHERIDWFFVAEKWQGKPAIGEPDKCNKLVWFPLKKLPANVIPYVQTAINNYVKGIIYSEFGWKK